MKNPSHQDNKTLLASLHHQYFTMSSQASTRASSTGASRSRNKSLAPASFQKQLQAALSVHCMTWVHTLDQMKLARVKKKQFERYHGCAESATLAAVDDCVSDDNAFASLWDRPEDSPSLTLKRCMSQRDDVIYSVGSSFTVSSLSSANQSTPVLIDGRAIYTLATNALKNGKKALSIE